MPNKKENIRKIYASIRHNFKMLLTVSFYSLKIKNNKFIVLSKEEHFMSPGSLTPTREKKEHSKNNDYV